MAQGYAQPSAQTSNAPVAQDPISNVLAQALQQCEDVEARIKTLRERLQMGPAMLEGKNSAPVPPQGIISQANGLRNVSARLQALCSELETML